MVIAADRRRAAESRAGSKASRIVARLRSAAAAPYLVTMRDLRTIGTLHELTLISEEEVGAAVEAFLSGSAAGMFLFRAGYRLNLVKAVRSHPGAREFVGRANVGIGLKRPFVRAAILQARPLAT